MDQPDDHQADGLPPKVRAFVNRLYRDPRYLLLEKTERFGRPRISFIEGCTLLSATGEVRGQVLLNREYEREGRPDGERPYGHDSLLDFLLQARGGEEVSLSDEDLAALQEESWQYYVRRNFSFLLGDYHQARDDAEHNLAIWDLVARSAAPDDDKWTYLKWWPWIERDRAIAQALWDLRHGEPEHAAAELYRARRSIEQFGQQHAAPYAEEEGDSAQLCSHMVEHVTALVDLLRRDADLPVSLEEQLDLASARGDAAEMERLREEMIRRAVDEPD